MNRLRQLLLILPLVTVAAVMSLSGHAHADSYNSSNLIDESYFINANSMNQSSIQSFLNSKGGALASQTFATSGFGNQSAAWIIAYVSQHVGLNPQSIMANMQKEESLITDPSPSSSQYNFAMGYGCPDSGSCSDSGFWNQTIDGSWQLRFNFERSGGNNSYWTAPDGTQWGNPSITYPCPSATRYYSTGLYSGRNVTFYDDSGSAYVNLTIANRSTAALYCYTPHVYPGSGSEFYSGSYNFVQSFISWWGNVHIPNYSATYYAQSAWPTIASGGSSTAYFEYMNTGSVSWYDDSSIGSAPVGNYAVHLATADPLNRASQFGSAWGAGQNRPALTFATVYQGDGTTLASNQHIVAPGQIVKFSFTFNVPSSVAAGVYQENFMPVAEGSSNGLFTDPGTYLDVTVSPAYTATGFAQSANPTIKPGQGQTSFIEYQNTGNVPWYDDLSVFSNPGGNPTHLATADALNRASVFGASWGTNKNRPALVFTAVYNSDGTTLAANQHVVQPGQIGKFTIPFTVPSQQAANTYKENFQPVQEGTTDGAFNDPNTFFNVVVPSATVGTYASGNAQSQTNMNPGSSQSYTLSFTNTGNTTWTPSNTYLTGDPSSSYQNFKAGSWVSSTDIAPLNESSVAPGATGTFTFNLTAPNTGGSFAFGVAPTTDGSYFSPAPGQFNITVANPVYGAQYYSQSSWPSALPGASPTGYFEYKNTGNVVWYDDSSIGSAPAGSFPVHLATAAPINRASVFGSGWGAGHNRPDLTFTAVYNADGTTLATNQHQVQPGQIAKFGFTFAISSSQAPGTYQENFAPVAEGSSNGLFGDPGTYLVVTVQPKTYLDQFVSQSAYPTVPRGQTATGYFEFKNVGNQTWYDDTGLSEAAAGTLPVHLATSQPTNRASVFGATWGANHNRPNLTFTAVYQSDGTTLTSDQHAVAPGQIAKFQFTFTASSSQASGTYREFFRPVLEGSADGALNDPDAYLDVTVP